MNNVGPNLFKTGLNRIRINVSIRSDNWGAPITHGHTGTLTHGHTHTLTHTTHTHTHTHSDTDIQTRTHTHTHKYTHTHTHTHTQTPIGNCFLACWTRFLRISEWG